MFLKLLVIVSGFFFWGGGGGGGGGGTGGVYNGIHNDSVVIMSKCGCLTALFDVEKKQ